MYGKVTGVSGGGSGGPINWADILNKPTNLETTEGSQSKADTAEANAKTYADTNKIDKTGGTITGPLVRAYPNSKRYKDLAFYAFSVGNTSSVKIVIPKAKVNANVQLLITGGLAVGGSSSKNWSIMLTGQITSAAPNGWTGARAIVTGEPQFSSMSVGFDGTNIFVILGAIDTNWSPRSFINISEVNIFGNEIDGWENNWTIDLLADPSTITTKLNVTMDKLASTSYVDSKASSGLNLSSYGVVNDGVADDTVGLKAYIADMQSKGKPVIIPASKNKYIISDTLLIQSPTHIYGEGDGTWIHSTVNDRAPIKFLSTNNCSIKNMKISSLADTRTSSFQGAVTIQGCDQVLAENLTIDGAAATGFFVTDSSNVKIHSNRVLNTLADGIHTTSKSKNVIVSNNHCVNAGDDSISTVSYQSQGAQCENVIITNNAITNGKSRGITNIGSSHVIIEGNTINGTASCGILSHRDSNPNYNTYESYNTTISNNIVRNAGSVTPLVGNQNGIEIGPSTLTKLVSNTVEGALHRGIAVLEGAKDVTMDDNDSNGSQIAGYLISDAIGVMAGVNRARNSGEQGVLIINSSYCTFKDFQIYDSAVLVINKHNLHIENCNNLIFGDVISMDTRTTQRIERAFFITNSTNVKHGTIIMNKGTRPFYTDTCTNIDAYPFTQTTAPTTAVFFNVFRIGQQIINTTDKKIYMWNGTAWVTLTTSA